MAAANIAILTIGVFAAAAITQDSAVTAAGVTATAGGNAIGFANTGTTTVGERVPVTALGTAKAIAGAAIAVGAAVEVGATGRVITKSAGIAVGRALTAAAAAGDQIEVLVIPN